MRWAGYILASVALVCALAYVFWFNAAAAEFHLGGLWTVRAPLGAELIAAFVLGISLVLLGTGFRESCRAVARWRRRGRTRKEVRLQELLERGRRTLWEGNPEQARALLLRAWRSRPNRETFLSLVEAHLQSDGPHEARRLFQHLDGGLADDPDILCALAAVCRQMGDTAAAITTLERARGRYPHAARILLELRALYIDAGRWDEAATVQAQQLALKSHRPVPADQSMLAGVRYEAAMRIPGREARLRSLEEVAAKFPRFVPATVSLGDELVATGHTADAARLWEHLFRQEPRAVLAERLAGIAQDRKARDRLRAGIRRLRGNQLNADAARLFAARLWLADEDEDAAGTEIESVDGATAPAPYHLLAAQLSERRRQSAQALANYREVASALPTYRCIACGRVAGSWRAFCAPCRRWDTFRSALEFVRG